MSQQTERVQLWQQLVSQIRIEYCQLEGPELNWIQQSCKRISNLQEQLDRLFKQGDGLQQCRDCRGDCCALGHNHLILANLLLFLAQDVEPPQLDFTASCPLLRSRGCLLPARLRPYNCISFLCDRIEGQLEKDEVESFYALEKELRVLYQSFAEHFAGGSMSGLLLAARCLQGQPFLQRIDIA